MNRNKNGQGRVHAHRAQVQRRTSERRSTGCVFETSSGSYRRKEYNQQMVCTDDEREREKRNETAKQTNEREKERKEKQKL